MIRPSIAEARAHAITDRLEQWPLSDDERAALKPRFATQWKRHGALASIAFFVLTALAVAAFAAFCKLFFDTTYPAAVICIAGAELLILGRRMYGTGIEAALWIGGALSFIFGLPHSGAPEAMLVIAAAFGIVAWRMQSALFGAVGTLFVAAYFIDIWDNAHHYWRAAAIPLAMLIIAALAKRFTFRRPWLESLLSYLVIVMPLVAEVGGRSATSRGDLEYVIAYTAIGISLIAWGVVIRDHALFIGGGVCIAVASYEARNLLRLAVEWRLIAGGLVLFAVAAAVARLLRGRETGFISKPERLTRYDELLKMAGSLAAGSMVHERPAAEPQSPAGTAGGSGSFGGGGASGDF